MITDRDRDIIRYFETYKYATLQQLEKIFFKEQKYSYNIARKRMLEIQKAGYVKSHRYIDTNKLVYTLNESKIKVPSKHRLLILDALAELHYMGLEVQEFEIEKFWQGGKIRSDAFTVFVLDNDNAKNRYHYFIEIHISNNPYNLEKYDVLYESGEVQRYLGRDVFPRILLITDRNHKLKELRHAKIITVNAKLESFAAVILP